MKALVKYLETLVITQGPEEGKPLKVLPWKRRFLGGAFREGISSACLSVARGNGKSTLVAGVATAALDGPLMVPRGEVLCVAGNFNQARLVFDHVLAFLGERAAKFRVQDTMNFAAITNRETGARVRVMGSDPKGLHGVAPSLVLADEPAQWMPTKADAARAALETSLGKIRGSRFIALGTQSASPHH